MTLFAVQHSAQRSLVYPSAPNYSEMIGRKMKISDALQNSGSKKSHFVCDEEIIFARRKSRITSVCVRKLSIVL